jgi:hypothetical protein
VQETEPGQLPGGEAGLLAQFEPGQLGRLAGLAGREAALRERPGTPLDRVPVLLDQVEPAVLGRDDQGEVALFDDRVRACDPSRRSIWSCLSRIQESW